MKCSAANGNGARAWRNSPKSGRKHSTKPAPHLCVEMAILQGRSNNDLSHRLEKQQTDKLLFGDFRTYCVNTAGEALMPPVGHPVFAKKPGISGHFTAGRHQCLPYSKVVPHCGIWRANNRAPLKTPFWLLSGSFALTMRFENPAIHPVFRNFRNFCENKISRPKPQKVVFRGRQQFMVLQNQTFSPE